jgi:hypothetical protein
LNTWTYQPEEAEWLSTTAFNVAIDYYLERDDASAKRWAEKAIMMAQFVDDGILQGVLRTKFTRLDWSGLKGRV